MNARTAWQALIGRDLLLSSWPWRSALYLAGGAVGGAVWLVLLVCVLALGFASSLVLVGVPLLVSLSLVGLPVGALERWRLRLVDLDPPADPHAPPGEPGVRPWLGTRWREPVTWSELGFAVAWATVLWPLELAAVLFVAGVPLALLSAPAALALSGRTEIKVLKWWTLTSYPQAWAMVPVGLLALVAAAYLLTALAGGRGALTRLFLTSRGTGLDERLVELARSRVRLVDAFEVERRRIERDLHDGAQQRLVALKMTLGMARLSDGPEAAELVAKAHAEAGQVLNDLRALIRGIHPQILTDRGLPAAIAELADRSPVAVDVHADLPGRFPFPVESAVYFVVCEALTNVAKHSGAQTASVRTGYENGRLRIEIQDDGEGGADLSRGTGLAGIADRVSVIDGRLLLSSPPGGPTLLRLEVPCQTEDRPG